MAGIIEQINPTALTIDTNIRTTAPIDKGFVDSIAANGVLTPILAWRDAEGAVRVRAGQRRTLAAREAGLQAVPVFVVEEAADTAQRIIEQIVENDQREGLTEADRIQAWRQLELGGVSVTKIAQRTGTQRGRVKTGLTVAANATSAAAVAEFGMTLDQAAALIEFEDDPELVATLTRYAVEDPNYFPVAVQRAHNDRHRAALREKVEAEEAAKGHRILTDRPEWNQTPYRLHDLTTADGDPVTEELVQDQPGVAVYVGVNYRDEVQVSYYIDAPAAFGYAVRENVHVSVSQAGPMTDEQKAERKVLIANNKEWDAAETVRRNWLTAFLARKTLPKNASTVIAWALSASRYTVATSMQQGNAVATALLGIGDGYGERIAAHLEQHPTRATHVALAIALGGIEQGTSRNTWRQPVTETARYFQALAAWGYPLCPVEKIAAMIQDDDATE